MSLVAILDSGVTPGHPHIGNVVGGIAITPHGDSEDFTDWLGHGTAVAAVIHEQSPEAGLLIVKIFGRQLACSIDQLVRGLEFALDQRATFINLSLGTQNPAYIDRLSTLVERSLAQSARIISARAADDKICYPGSLPGVISVSADESLSRHEVRFEGNLASASPYPRPIPGVPPERNLHGISFAVANVTAYLARSRGIFNCS